jgi:hypothetical protein
MRRSLYLSQVGAAAIVLLGTLISGSALAQLVTTLSVTAARQASQLRPDAQGNSIDVINHTTTANYIVTVRNTGTSRAFGVSVNGTLVLPASPAAPTQITTVTPSPTCTVGSDKLSFSCTNVGTLEASLPDGMLPDGGFLPSTTTTITVTVSLGLPPSGSACTAGLPLGTVTATASATNAPPVSNSTSNTTILPLADLAVTLTGPNTAKEGATITFQATAQNNGPCAANRVLLTNDDAPVGGKGAGLLFQSNSGGCTGGFPCLLGNPWPAGASVNITSSYVVANLRDTITSLTSTGDPNELDIASMNTNNPDGGTPLAFATLDPVTSNNAAITQTVVTNTSGCNSVGISTLTLFGLAVVAAVFILRQRRRS